MDINTETYKDAYMQCKKYKILHGTYNMSMQIDTDNLDECAKLLWISLTRECECGYPIIGTEYGAYHNLYKCYF
jgi:hypothetical protein